MSNASLNPEGGERIGGPGKPGAFVSRLSSTVILWGLVAAAVVFSQPLLYMVLILAVVSTSVWEYFRMVDLAGVRGRSVVMVLLSVGYLAVLFREGQGGMASAAGVAVVDSIALLLVFGFAVLSELRFTPRPGGGMERVTVTLFGFLWIPFLFGFVVKLLFLNVDTGMFYVLFLLVVTKFTDMGAYVTGSLLGKHSFMKHISPKKTWEGIGGGMVFALGAAFGMLAILGEKLPMIEWSDAGVLGILLGISAVAGDLVESMVKRSWETKDSGHVLPGIGGTLDLIDSICFGAPVMYWYLIFAA